MCVFIYLTSIISYFSGLILSLIVEKDKRDFEHYLNIISSIKLFGINIKDYQV